MQSNYSKIGPYIRRIDQRNVNDKKENLLGVSVSKVFMKSIANTVGTDFRTYKIVKRGQFTYIPDTSRRGEKIGISLLDSYDEGLVSPVYTVFEVSDTNKLDPEYLMMWFRRPEFDRYARFISHGSVREIFEWEDMANVSLPLPSIEKQREIVAEYHTIQNRIALNNQLIQTLETTAQAIYKQWFVEFEFPNEAGQPYKSSGGEMVDSALGEIPKGWRDGVLNELVDIVDGDRGANYPGTHEMTPNGFCLFLNAGNVTKRGFDFSETSFITQEKDQKLRKGKLKRYDIVFTSRGTVGNSAFYSEFIEYDNVRINSGMVIMRAKTGLEMIPYVYSTLRSTDTKKAVENFISGSAQPQLPIKDLIKIPVVIPEAGVVSKFSKLAYTIQSQLDGMNKQNLKLKIFSNLLLSKLATIETTPSAPQPAAAAPAQLTLSFA